MTTPKQFADGLNALHKLGRARKSDLTPVATEGYKDGGAKNPYLQSSSNWFAFEIGKYLQRTGRTAPRDVRMGRGYQVHANGMLLAFDARNAITRAK